ncbi:hypothetical protein D910_00137, partial [Dendroctonus ponderosae]
MCSIVYIIIHLIVCLPTQEPQTTAFHAIALMAAPAFSWKRSSLCALSVPPDTRGTDATSAPMDTLETPLDGSGRPPHARCANATRTSTPTPLEIATPQLGNACAASTTLEGPGARFAYKVTPLPSVLAEFPRQSSGILQGFMEMRSCSRRATASAASATQLALKATLQGSSSATLQLGTALARSAWWARTAISARRDSTTCKAEKVARAATATLSARTIKPATCLVGSAIVDRGPRCDHCEARKYGFSSDGCLECDCDAIGSKDLQCDTTGQCPCLDNVEGRRCDKCKENKYDRHRGCV